MNSPRLEHATAPTSQIIDPRTGAVVDWKADEWAEGKCYDQVPNILRARNKMRRGKGSYATPRDISDFIEYRFFVDKDVPIQFHLRPWQKGIMNAEHTVRKGKDGKKRVRRQTLLKCARQTEKSTGLGNKLLAFSMMISNLTALYVSSAGLNMQEFSDERIENVLRISPELKEFTGAFVSYSRYVKRFAKNNSRILMRSAHLNASRTRGIPADVLAIDEIQDFVMGHLPVIFACLNNSELDDGPITLLSGTPLTFDNPIEHIWSKNSTKNMWATKCQGCNKHNFPPQTPTEADRMVGPKGLLCFKCGRSINPLLGEWVRTGSQQARYEGFHLSRVMMPYTRITSQRAFDSKWSKFYDDATDPVVPDGSKMNEIYGVSWDNGAKPISREELIACCHPDIDRMSRIAPPEVVNDPEYPIFAGIDWGAGTGEGAYTVISLAYPVEHEGRIRMQVFYMHRYMGREAEENYVAEDIAQLLEINKVSIALCDAGFGWGMIPMIRKLIVDGMERLIPLRYTNQNSVISYEGASHIFQCNRTRWMSKIFGQFKEQVISLPSWELMDGVLQPDRGFGQDILTISAEQRPNQKQTQFVHTDPDDAFHSLLYVRTAMMYWFRELDEFLNA